MLPGYSPWPLTAPGASTYDICVLAQSGPVLDSKLFYSRVISMLTRVLSLARIAILTWPVLLLGTLAAGSTTVAGAEYRVHAGDIIEVMVAGMPELTQRVTVQIDGGISLPLLGTVIVAGSTTSEARAKIQAALATKVFRHTTADGRDRPVVIKFDEISASVVGYRPIYADGDVLKPGELTYRPHMTVRQAVAAAGGYFEHSLRFQTQTMSAVRDVIGLHGEYASLWVSLAKERLLVWRLTSELGEAAELNPKVLQSVPLPKATLAKFMSMEAEHLKARKSNFERETAFLKHSIAKVGEHIAALEEQQKKEDEGIKADFKELESATRLFKRGLMITPRLTEARRALLLSTTRQVQTRSQLIQTMRERDALKRQLEKLPDELRISLLKEWQEARTRLEVVRAKLKAIEEKLPYTMNPLGTGRSNKQPRITVFRNDLRAERSFIGTGDTELHPGDVVQVVLLPAETGEMAAR